MNSRNLTYILQFLIGLTLIILLNALLSKLVWRWDLTEDKRYSITEASRTILANLDDVIYVEVYLEGDLNADFKRFQKAIKETLDEFQVYAGKRIQYEFVNPDQAESQQARNDYYRSLMQKGIVPTNLQDRRDGKKVEKLIFPAALLSYSGAEQPVMLLKGNSLEGYQQAINQSIEGIEYELIAAIRKLTGGERKRIALVGGHGEKNGQQIVALKRNLEEKYTLQTVDLKQIKDLTTYDACIWIQPETAFAETELFKIDQYLMKGGNLLFFQNALQVYMDSISDVGHYAFPYETGLENLFFRYGVRLDHNLLQDVNSGDFPLVRGQFGEKAQIRMVPWPFYVIVNKFGNHPTVRNMDAVYAKFVGSIDTVKADGVIKTPLLFSSGYTRELKAPARVNFNDLKTDIVPEAFNKQHLPLAYLLEGSFTSYFKNKFLPKGFNAEQFQEEGSNGKVLLVADGNFLNNEINRQNGNPLPLGFDPYSNVNYANADFLENTLSYMTDEEGIITARAKEVKIRPLDKVKINKEKTLWQSLNIVLPVILLLLFGFVRYFLRKRRYGA